MVGEGRHEQERSRDDDDDGEDGLDGDWLDVGGARGSGPRQFAARDNRRHTNQGSSREDHLASLQMSFMR
jgi:hypothetical protein